MIARCCCWTGEQLVARQIVVERGGKVSTFDFKKIDRSKLYGKRRRIPLDPEGEPCVRAQLTSDGAQLVRSGMLAQGYFGVQGNWIPQREMVGLDGAGRPVDAVPSTLGEQQELEGPVPAEDLLDMQVSSVYALDGADVDAGLLKSLEGGDLFRFNFNFRSDFHAEVAYLLANQDGVYCLVGSPAVVQWCELGQVIEESFEEDSDDDEDLDFEMF